MFEKYFEDNTFSTMLYKFRSTAVDLFFDMDLWESNSTTSGVNSIH